MFVEALLAKALAERPEDPAFSDGTMCLTYAQLNRKVQGLARWLREAGVGQGKVVGILMRNSPLYPVAFLGSVRAGATAMLLSSFSSQDELLRLLRRHCVDCAIVDTALSAASEAAGLGAGELLVRVGRAGFIDRRGCVIEENTELPPAVDDSLSRPILQQCSSGSMGDPKCVVRSGAMVLAEARNLSDGVGYRESDRALCVLPMFHEYGFIAGMIAPAYAGCSVRTLSWPVPADIMRTIQDEAITLLPAVPHTYWLLCRTRLERPPAWTSVRLCFSSGAPLSKQVAEDFYQRFGIPISQFFGTTETGAIAVNSTDPFNRWASVGKPLPNVAVIICDEHGKQCEPGESGELLVRSDSMFSEYRGQPRVSRTVFHQGWYRTGDLAHTDADGFLYVDGRLDDMINVAGLKVYPLEVETVLLSHPLVQQAVVVGVPDRSAGEVVKAVVVLSGNASPRDMQRYCAEHLSPYKVPRIIEIRNELPLTPSGKVVRRLVKDAE